METEPAEGHEVPALQVGEVAPAPAREADTDVPALRAHVDAAPRDAVVVSEVQEPTVECPADDEGADTMTTTAAIYARRSVAQEGAAGEDLSVERQVALAREFAAAKGWTVDDRYVFQRRRHLRRLAAHEAARQGPTA